MQVDVAGVRTEYDITFRGPAVCPIGGGGGPGGGEEEGWGGLSWFSSLLLVLLGLAAVYIGVGYAYNKNVHGLSGTEALPHREFWLELPSVLSEACARTGREVRDVLRSWRRPAGVTEPLAPSDQPA